MVCRSVCHRDTLRSSLQRQNEPMEMPFGLWAQMGPENHVLDGSSEMLRDVAMATNFGMQFAITAFLAFDEV